MPIKPFSVILESKTKLSTFLQQEAYNHMHLFTVAIMGRPNVGKSTLFNRLAGKRQAIVHDMPGVTRDRHYATCTWSGKEFTLIDTGGLIPGSEEGLSPLIRKQAEAAIEEADLALLVVDAKEGVNPLDEEIAQILRRKGKTTLLVVNKVDSPLAQAKQVEFFALGLGEPFAISAEHGLGVGDLLDVISRQAPLEETQAAEEEIKLAVMGRPNVGKSSLVNRLLGQERVLVSEVAGTTRDAIDTPFGWKGERFLIIDTAGLRAKRKITQSIELFSSAVARKSLRRADLALLVIEAPEGATEQDAKIAALIQEAGASCILVANKWDLLLNPSKEWEQKQRERLTFMDYVPLLTISALSGQGVEKILPLVQKIYRQRKTKVETAELNQLLHQWLSQHEPPVFRGKRPKIYYSTQVSSSPPTFLLFTNLPRGFSDSYQRYLVNQIRRHWPYPGTPLRLVFKGKRKE